MKARRLYQSDIIAILAFRLGATAAIAISIGFILVGLFQMVVAFSHYFSNFLAELRGAVSPEIPSGHYLQETLLAGIEAIELFSLAPLPYLLLTSFGAVISERSFPDREGNADGARSHIELNRIKSLVAGLMITSIAASLVGKAFGPGIDIQSALGGSIVIAVLLVYYFLCHLHASRPSSRQAANKLDT